VNGILFHDLHFLRYHAEDQIALRADAPVVEQTPQLPMHPALESAHQERVLAALDAAVQGG
jgi:hypothetical protein